MNETTKASVPESEESEQMPPKLWNPKIVANLSVLLTPIFGAYLHAKNWKTLGETQQASNSMKWFWGYIAFFCVFMSAGYVFDGCHSMDCNYGAITEIGSVFWWALFLIWRLTSARDQIRYVEEKYSNVYVHRSLIFGALRWVPIPLVVYVVTVVFVVALYAAEAKFKIWRLNAVAENRFEEWYQALKEADEAIYNAIKPHVIEFMKGGPEQELSRSRANRILGAALEQYLAVTTNAGARAFMETNLEYLYELCDRDLQLCFQCSQGNFELLVGRAKPNEKEAYIKAVEAMSDMIRAARTSPQPPIGVEECRLAIGAVAQKAADSLGQDVLLLDNATDPNLDIAAYMRTLRRFYELVFEMPPEEGGKAIRCLLVN